MGKNGSLEARKESQGMVGEMPWANEFLPNRGNVQPWSTQCVPILHETSGEIRMRTLGGDKDMRPLSFLQEV